MVGLPRPVVDGLPSQTMTRGRLTASLRPSWSAKANGGERFPQH